MKTKLDSNGLTVYTLPTKEDCLTALYNLKTETKDEEISKFHSWIEQIDKTIEFVKNDNFNELLKFKYHTINYKPLQRIIYIFEKDYLHELWSQ
ncbi:hypothetical protein ABE073_04145 [Lederbergia citrisecunda]|uniref:hypothetical protein n=1 Tax=Lederbergia citrisecunda TaxID=2833583 RepID=UPI003D2DC0DE